MQSKRDKLTITTPDTLLVGVYIENDWAAITASLRPQAGDIRNDILLSTGEPYFELAKALVELAEVRARNLLILTTDADLYRRLHKPFCFSDAHPQEWPRPYWTILRECTSYGLYGAWRCLQVDDLPKARELWNQQQQLNTTE
jgi:hypothetical protein